MPPRYAPTEGQAVARGSPGPRGPKNEVLEVVGEGSGTLEEGSGVQFDVADGRRGKQASRVEVVG